MPGGYEPGELVAYNDDRPDSPNWQQTYGSSFWFQVPYSGSVTHYIIEVERTALGRRESSKC